VIKRESHIKALESLLSRHPVVGIVGARQVGKTTLARVLADRRKEKVHYFDLENPDELNMLREPMMALKKLHGLVVIDEVQRLPEIFQVLRVLVDRPRTPARFLVLGSASPELLKQSSETLAGRILYHKLGGFSLDEVGMDKGESLWLRGGFPRSFLAESDEESDQWRRGFIQTFLERDLPQLGIGVKATTLRRFWMMLAHYHGQVWNASEIARSFGVSHTAVRNYLDVMTSALIVRQVPPWHENIGKRQVKSPKVYVADSGLLHTLLKCVGLDDLEGHPKMGASWEGFVLNELIRRVGASDDECYFWATHAGAELDLVVIRGRKRLGFEIKRTSVPRVTPSMRSALDDLGLESIDLVHAGDRTFPLAERIRAVAFSRMFEDIRRL
jgi:predicted AAA+ superfamily ATPase